MADVIIFQRHYQRRGTAAAWSLANPTLAEGEIGYETDTKKWKFGDGATAWNALVYKIDDAPIDGTEYVRKDGAWASAAGGGGDSFSSTSYILREDFDRGFSTSTATGTSFVTTQALPVVYESTAGISTYAASVSGGPGVVSLSTGTSSSGYSNCFITAGLRIVLGGGEMRIRYRFRLPNLSDATNTYTVLFGLRDMISGTSTDLVNAIYSHGINSGNWQLLTRNSGTTTTVNGTAGPSANTWTTLEFVINAAASNIELFADGVSMGSSSTNIPTVALGVQALITKSVGTTARTLQLDLAQVKQTLTTAR